MTTHTSNPVEIYLQDDQLAALEALADQRGISVAAVIREQVATLIGNIPLVATGDGTASAIHSNPFLQLSGIMDSGVTDLGDEHDRYLAEFIEEDNR